jgi:hypothetical protein
MRTERKRTELVDIYFYILFVEAKADTETSKINIKT